MLPYRRPLATQSFRITIYPHHCSAHTPPCLPRLTGVIRERVLTLISRAYTSITLTDLAAFAGLPADRVADMARERGWVVDGTVVGPKPAPPTVQTTVNCEKSLAVLTQYVSFLEN